MMNSSNGFQGGSSLLGNSTGFKKRPLLRPASGMLNKRLEFLRSVDVSQSQPAIATLLRSQVAAIEQQINLLDKDRRIRQSQGGLQKGYATSFRKWLRQGQTLNEKEDDDTKILKHLGADSYQSGFRKLWKIVCQLDLMVTKISQLQIIHFLIYDEMFGDIGKDTPRSTGILSSIANNGYISGTFQITQILLDRFKDVYAATKKTSSSYKNKDQKQRDETAELISQLKAENSKLKTMLEQLSAERLSAKQQTQKQQTKIKEKPSSYDVANPKQAFREIQEKFQQQLRYLNSEKARAEQSVISLKVKVAALQSQAKADAQLFKATSHNSKPKAGSYEEALMQEMEKMKKGFQRKIAILNQEFAARQKELRKKEIQYKTENEKIKWQKSLLLKKFELIPTK